MTDQYINCGHCSGSGTCKSAGGKSCDECILEFRKNKGANDNVNIVACSKCKGVGKRNIDKENWHEQSMQTLKESAKNPLPQFHITQKENSRRYFDKNRFTISKIVIFIGLFIIVLAVILEYKKPGSNFLSALLPVGSSMITGVLVYYVSIDKNRKKDNTNNG